MSDKIVSEDILNPDSHSQEEVVMEYDNWSSDDEETLQVHPETILSLPSGESWGDNSVTHNHGLDDTDHPMV